MGGPCRVTCVGVDVSKDRLNVHLRPTGEACRRGDGKGLQHFVDRLLAREVLLVVLDAIGGLRGTAALLWPPPACRWRWSIRVRSGTSRARSAIRQDRRHRRRDRQLCSPNASRPRRARSPPRTPDGSAKSSQGGRRIAEMTGVEQNRRRAAADKRLIKKIDRHVAFLEKELRRRRRRSRFKILRASAAGRPLDGSIFSATSVSETQGGLTTFT
jgi:transposase